MSLARAHFLRKTAQATAKDAEPGAQVKANAYELQLIQLAEAKRALKQVQSVERKAEVKRRVLPEFAPWVRGVLDGNAGGQDDVVMTTMVWLIDIGEFGSALDIAAYALQHGLTLPDTYKRDVATLVVEEIAEQSQAAFAAGKPVDLESLERVGELTANRDMPDEVRAKLFKALGCAYRARAEASDPHDAEGLAAALAAFKRALQLHDRVGVKKEIEQLERALKPST